MDLSRRARQIIDKVYQKRAGQKVNIGKRVQNNEKTSERYMMAMILDVFEASAYETVITKVRIEETFLPNQVICFVSFLENEEKWFTANCCYGPYLYYERFIDSFLQKDNMLYCPRTAEAVARFENTFFPQYIISKVYKEFKNLNIPQYGVKLTNFDHRLEISIL